MNFLEKAEQLIFLKSISGKSRKNTPLSTEERNTILAENQAAFSHNTTLEDIAVDADKSTSLTKEASAVLKKNGIVVLKNFVANDLALAAGKEFLAFMKEKDITNQLDAEAFFETEDFLAQNGRAKLNGYHEYAKSEKMVVVRRQKNTEAVDGGMIDCFGLTKFPDRERFSSVDKCYAKMSDGSVRDIILDQTKKKVKQQQLNLYYNQSVVNPRALHVDSVFESYKAFLYLSDCEDLSCGPYSFIPKSPLKRRAIMKNIKRNFESSEPKHHEDILVDESLAVPLRGKAGTLIITVQNGIHGGVEQEEGKERIVLVDNYYG